MGFRRHCYDKPWRCPGWAGGGWKRPSDKRDICDGGSFAPHWKSGCQWHFHKCYWCGTVAVPLVTRWLDPTWWKFVLTRKVPQWLEWRRDLRQIRRERKGQTNEP